MTKMVPADPNILGFEEPNFPKYIYVNTENATNLDFGLIAFSG